MTQEKVSLYEAMYIINSTLTEDAKKRVVDEITTEMERLGGKIEKLHDMGRKRLAYEINGHKEGHYYLIYFTSPTSIIKSMKEQYRYMPDMVRYMILTAEKILETLEYKELEV